MADRTPTLVAALLALPFALLFTLLMLGIEPPLGPLDPLVRAPADTPNVVGSVIVIGAWLLCGVAFAISVTPLVHDARAGLPITREPTRVAVSAVTLALVLAFVIAFAVDQYPCWIGVPNCD